VDPLPPFLLMLDPALQAGGGLPSQLRAPTGSPQPCSGDDQHHDGDEEFGHDLALWMTLDIDTSDVRHSPTFPSAMEGDMVL
jgi:hypothetical protein